MLPRLVMSVVSAKVPSQFLLVAKDMSVNVFLDRGLYAIIKSNNWDISLEYEFVLKENTKAKGKKKDIIIIIPKGTLLAVALNNSEILILININMKMNNIETAPT